MHLQIEIQGPDPRGIEGISRDQNRDLTHFNGVLAPVNGGSLETGTTSRYEDYFKNEEQALVLYHLQ